MTQAAIACDGVTKQYGNTFAVKDLNLSIPDGGVVGILGPNGSGKSTLFRLLTGLTHADSGSITVLGQRPGWRTNREIAYLPDRARWYPDHTVLQAFAWAENFLPRFNPSAAERFASLMNIDRDMRVGGMSRGQEARLMLTICVAREVPLIILDEPFSGIDVISRERIIEGLIDHMTDTETTILISTHEIYEAESLFDRAVFMNEGRVQLAGEADELRGQYGSMHTIVQNLYR